MKRFLRIIGWVAAIFVVLLIIAVVGLWLFFPVEKAKELAIEKGSAQLGRTIAIDNAQVSFWGGLGIKLGDVTVSNPPDFPDGNFLAADNVDVKLQILPLITGKYRIDRLVINRPEITLLKREDGSNNYTFEKAEEKAQERIPPEVLEKAPPEAKAAAIAVTFERLEINDGKLSYTDDSSKTSFVLNGLNLSTSLANPRQNLYESSGRIRIDSATVATDMPLPAMQVTLDYRAEYDVAGKRISFEESRLELNKIKMALEGELTDPLGQMTARVNAKSERVSVGDLLSLLPGERPEAMKSLKLDGDFALDLDVEYNPELPDTLAYYGTAVVTSMKVAHTEVPGKLELKRALVDFENDNLRFNIEDAYFDGKPVKGHVVVDNFDDPVVNGEFAGTLNLAYLQPFLPARDEHVVSGTTEFDVKLSGKTKDFTAMNFSGCVQVVGGSYRSRLLFEPMESFDLDVYFDNRLTHVKKLSARMASGNVSFSGRLNDLVPYFMADSVGRSSIAPTVDGSLSANVNLAVANSFLPPKGKPELQGKLSLELSLAGVLTQYEKIRPSGKVVITDGSYVDSLLPEPITHFEAEMAVSPDTIEIKNLTAKFVSSDASFSGKLADPFPYLLPFEGIDRSQVKKPMFLFKLWSHRFDTDKLFPEAVPGSGENRTTVSLDSVSTIILPDIDGQGTFNADTVIYSRVELISVEGKIKIYDRKIECYDATGKVYTGDVSGKTIIDLNNFNQPRYTGDFKATNVEANDFISRFTKFGGFVFGKINLEGSYSAAGWEPDAFLKSLTMDSDYLQNQGKLVTSGVVFSALSNLASMAKETFDKEQPLRDLKTKIVVRDGRVSVDKLKTKLGSIGDVELDGSYPLLGGDLDFGGTILLSQEWTEKVMSQKGLLGNLAGLLTDKSVNRLKLPVGLSGPPGGLKFDIDYTAITKAMGDNLKDDASSALQNLLKKKKD